MPHLQRLAGEKVPFVPGRGLGALTTSVFIVTCMIGVASAQSPPDASQRVGRESGHPVTVAVSARSASHTIQLDKIPTLVFTTNGAAPRYIEAPGTATGSVAGSCGEVTHADPEIFTTTDPVALNIQQGFAEDEIAYASFELDPSLFPIKIEAMECVFAQSTLVRTLTEWSVIIWDGPPVLGPGIPVAEFVSDDLFLQHLRMDTGLQAANVRIEIGPDDPEQIFVNNESGQNMVTLGFRIVEHNDPPIDPCAPPNPFNNAFPATDADDVSTLTNNWLSALTCDTDCDGVHTFGDLPVGCRPSGDWLIRLTFSCTLVGACCDADAVCTDNVVNTICTESGGTFMGDGAVCSEVVCPTPMGACCIGGYCFRDLIESICMGLDRGIYMGNGSVCSETLCDLGACCMADGTCDDLLALECDAVRGTWEGVGTVCLSTSCPQPLGSCCVDALCLRGQEREACETIGTWNGMDSTCDPNPCTGGECTDAATILDAVPPSGTVDARQPHEPANPLPRQGIGSVFEPILITLGVEGVEACFSLCETAEDQQLGTNGIANVTYMGGGQYQIVLDRAITAGAVTTIQYDGDGSFVEYVSHPANTDAGPVADTADVLFLIEVLNGTATAPHGSYSIDVDHGGMAGPPDILRTIDLLNGAHLFSAKPWLDTDLPINNTCPP